MVGPHSLSKHPTLGLGLGWITCLELHPSAGDEAERASRRQADISRHGLSLRRVGRRTTGHCSFRLVLSAANGAAAAGLAERRGDGGGLPARAPL